VAQFYLKQRYPVGDDYLLIREIGKGSYGAVVLAKHLPSGKSVAIKKIENVFSNPVDAKRLLREV